MSRSSWKENYINKFLFNFDYKNTDENVLIKTDMRNVTIIPAFLGYKFSVYNGIRFFDFTITENMIGQKLGEFSPTKKKALAKKNKKLKKKR